ncbi:uncharacterized protein LOC111679696 [Lucilia cuprina]|uniref:uncharacterized protein LOC111679696 n=1 Tax=Lucilia cuprina TaxID=7375 RepID=UPI001F070AE2|nr:uncharacterized protein LOC111679696 [Lucilia cuprina]
MANYYKQNQTDFLLNEQVQKKHGIEAVDRTFSLGPAVMARLLSFFDLNGDILQTHIDSPRSTAYLASLFYSVNRINNFYVYGSGSNLKRFRKYMEDLGVNNIRLFAESFTSFPLESNRFRTVVGIFANPPNSFSAISDPIDLICSRGGDLGMLEILTESSISDDGKQRVSLILEEQLHTLRMAMSRPQIQFLLYQTHSVVSSENQKMVEQTMSMINKTALKKHREAFLEKKRLEALEEAEAANIPSAAMNANSPRKQKNTLENKPHQNAKPDSAMLTMDQKNIGCPDDDEEVKLPEIDEFVSIDLPDLCKNQDNCLQTHDNGCFLSLLQRKSITRLNAKYLIQTAEKRGLFGKAEDSKILKSKQLKSQDYNVDHQNLKLIDDEDIKKSIPNVENLPSVSFADTTPCQTQTLAFGPDEKCKICGNKMDEKIPCMMLNRCNHTFHRSCIENALDVERECPICKQSCELEDLRKITFSVKQLVNKAKSKPSNVPTKFYSTRSYSKNLFQTSNTSGIDIFNSENSASATIRNENSNPSQLEQVSQEPGNINPHTSIQLLLDHDYINEMIEESLSKALQNFTFKNSQLLQPVDLIMISQMIETNVQTDVQNLNQGTIQNQSQRSVDNSPHLNFNASRNHQFHRFESNNRSQSNEPSPSRYASINSHFQSTHTLSVNADKVTSILNTK